MYDAKIEGKIEEKIEIARSSLRKRLSIDIISEITGLSIKEINSLKEQN
jgi:predicted transposase/invertase (TIGR01784 family)